MCGVSGDIKTEQCEICGYDTGYDGYDKIEDRKYYVENKGQLCSWCYKKILNKIEVRNK